MLQLIYASAATRTMDQDELAEILEKARLNNALKGISGMLVYHGGSFLQILEGPDAAVEALFDKISKDPRHTKMKLIFRGEIEEKEFDDWSMGFVNTSNRTKEIEGFVDYASELEELTLDRTRAKKVLNLFREGSWRLTVDA